jgi:hypothetical protein
MAANALLSQSLEPKTEDCSICGKTGCQTVDGWHTDFSIEHDETSYLAGRGEYLIDATDTPSGWVCSKRCRSQAMFNATSGYDREALLKVYDACRVIAEYGKDAMRVMEAGMEEAPVWLTDEAASLLQALGDDGNDMPEWCNHA